MSTVTSGEWTYTGALEPTSSSSFATYIGPGVESGDRQPPLGGCLAPICFNSCRVPEKPQKAAIVSTGDEGNVRETSYKYVGLGSSAFDLKRVPTILGIGPRGYCFLCGFMLLVAAAVAFLLSRPWLRSGLAEATGTADAAEGAERAAAREGPSHSYDCAGPQESWDPGEKAWCCIHERLGCQSSLPFDCDVDFLDWVRKWSKDKQVWCCLHRDRGCPRPLPLDGRGDPVDCSEATGGAVADWPAHKRRWCCANERRGCPRGPSELAFDCSVGVASWRQSWSDVKAKWCCAHRSLGCGAPLPFDCDDGLSEWYTSWPIEKKRWCCQHQRKGCPDGAGFDCAVGYDDWPVLWADGKQSWCCEHEGRGCPFACNETSWDGWSELQKSWCCRQRGQRCPVGRRLAAAQAR